jgi:Zn/Cd-binding protein ZinT
MKRSLFVAAIVLVLPFVFFGCRTTRSNGESELAQWNGTYNSLASYLDEPSFAGIFADKAGAKADLAEYLATDFVSVKIDGGAFTLYTARNAGGTPTTITYTFKQKIEPGRGVWYAFESDRSDKYKYLIATLPGQDDPEGALHFHFRYGAAGFDTLAAGANLPTAVKAGTPNDKVQEVVEEFFERFASLARWQGTYNSLSSYLDEPSFAEIFMGKEKARDLLAAFLATDFASCKIDGDTFTFYTARDAAGTAAGTLGYSLVRTIEIEEGSWYAFESDQSDDYKYLIATIPHQDDPEAAVHFHFRYGAADFDALAAVETSLPTAVKAGTPNDKVQEVVEEFLEYFASL